MHTAYTHPGEPGCYIVGGCDERGICIKSCRKFNVNSQKITYLGSLNKERKLAGVMKLHEKLYVFAGSNTFGNQIKSIEMFDLKQAFQHEYFLEL